MHKWCVRVLIKVVFAATENWNTNTDRDDFFCALDCPVEFFSEASFTTRPFIPFS